MDKLHLQKRYVFLLGHVKAMGFEKALTFACSCCERIVPIFEMYAAIELGSHVQVLRTALNLMWHHLMSETIPDDRTKEQPRPTSSIPLPSESLSSLLGAVQDVADTVDITMQCFLRQRAIDDIASVAESAASTVKEWISITSQFEHSTYPELPLWKMIGRALQAPYWSGASDDWMNQHPMIIAEYARQDLDLEVLTKVGRLTPDVVDTIRLCSRQEGVRPPGWKTLCRSILAE